MVVEKEDRSARKRELCMRCLWLQEQCKMLKVMKKEQKITFSSQARGTSTFTVEFLKMLSKMRRSKQCQELEDRVTKMKSFIGIYSQHHQFKTQ